MKDIKIKEWTSGMRDFREIDHFRTLTKLLTHDMISVLVIYFY